MYLPTNPIKVKKPPIMFITKILVVRYTYTRVYSYVKTFYMWIFILTVHYQMSIQLDMTS